jgi:hypothetical protein
MIEVVGLTHELWQEVSGSDAGWHHLFGAVEALSAYYREPIAAWVEANCAETGGSGIPGTLDVIGPSIPPGVVWVAVLPPGTDVTSLRDASDTLGVLCTEVHHSEQTWRASLIDRDSDWNSPCVYLHWEHAGTRRAVFPAGEYDLFVGLFPNGVGRFDLYIPAPELCATERITIGGATEVDLPELRPCSLGPLAGTAEEIARRRPPEPDVPTGPLLVMETGYIADVEESEYRLVVLPGGTTLNEVALGEAWPVGAVCMHYRPLDDIDPNVAARIESEGVPLPVMGYPAADGDIACIDPLDYLESGIAPRDLARLPDGPYDVRIQVYTWSEEEGESRRCAQMSVEVSGDTTVTAPPLGECP